MEYEKIIVDSRAHPLGHGLSYSKKVFLLFLAYSATGILGLSINAMSGFASMVWPPTGIALAVLFLYGNNLWPGVFLAAIFVNAWLGVPFLASLGIAAGNVFEALAGVYLLRSVGFSPKINRMQDVASLVLLAAVLSTTVSATIGIASLVMFAGPSPSTISETWITWWVGDATGNILIAPIVMLILTGRWPWPSRQKIAEYGLMVLLIAVLSIATFSPFLASKFGLNHFPRYFVFPFLIWMSLRFGQSAGLGATFIASAIAVIQTVIYPNSGISQSISQNLLFTQSFVAVASISTLVVAIVVTDRSHAKNALMQSESRLNLALIGSRMGTWDWDISTRKFTISDRTQEILALQNSTEIRYDQFLRMIYPDDFKRTMEGVKKTQNPSSNGEYDGEFRIQTCDGDIRHISVKGLTIFNLRGTPIRMVGTVLDVTESRRFHFALLDQAEKLRSIVDNVADGILTINSEFLITSWNAGAEKIFGYNCQEVEGQSLTSLVQDQSNLRSVLENACKSCAAGVPMNWEVIGKRKNNSSFFMELAVNQFILSGKNFYTVIVRDVTERKRFEEELIAAKVAADAANQEKSAFLANMSHEIRTPLGALIGFSELIVKQTIPKEDREKLASAIRRNGKLLSSIICDILDLSKIEAGKVEIEPAFVKMSHILSDIDSIFNLQAKEKGLVLNIEEVGFVPSVFQTDPIRLRQILINLLGNAFKFTSKGSVGLKVYSEETSDSRNLIYFDVQDTGDGIPADQSLKLFKPFAQGDSSIRRKFGGTGLGLVLSKKLAFHLGGDVVLVQSCVGNGSTFRLIIDGGPTLKSESNSDQMIYNLTKDKSATLDQGVDLSGVKILLAEDSIDNQNLIGRILQNAGASVEFANNGREAIHKALDQSYDLILMDLQMPEVDGFEATASLRKQNICKPIIALTAHVLTEDRNRCLATGFDDHIGKPINRNLLLSSIALRVKRTESISARL